MSLLANFVPLTGLQGIGCPNPQLQSFDLKPLPVRQAVWERKGTGRDPWASVVLCPAVLSRGLHGLRCPAWHGTGRNDRNCGVGGGRWRGEEGPLPHPQLGMRLGAASCQALPTPPLCSSCLCFPPVSLLPWSPESPWQPKSPSFAFPRTTTSTCWTRTATCPAWRSDPRLTSGRTMRGGCWDLAVGHLFIWLIGSSVSFLSPGRVVF